MASDFATLLATISQTIRAMKKNILWGLLTFIMVAMLSVGFAACSSDDDNNEKSTVDSRLIGTWTSTIAEGWSWNENGVLWNHWKDFSALKTRNYEIINGIETGNYTDYTNDEAEWTTVTFKADGSYIEEDEEDSFEGTFTTKDDVIIIDGTDFWNYSFEDGKLKLIAEEYKDGVLRNREINWYEIRK